MKHGADVKAADSRGITPLHLAAGIGCENLVQQLIVAGADINVQDYARENGGGQETPLHRAAVGGHLEALRQLIHGGAQVKNIKPQALCSYVHSLNNTGGYWRS